MGDIDRLEKLYRKFNLYVDKGNKIGLYKEDKELIGKLMIDIIQCEMGIIDSLFDDLILVDIVDEYCLDLIGEIEMLTGWDMRTVNEESIFIRGEYQYIVKILKELQYKMNLNFIKSFKKIEEYSYFEDIISLLNKYVEGKNKMDICQKYFNNRFFDMYDILEEKNEEIEKMCGHRECK